MADETICAYGSGERDELTTNLWRTDCDGDVLLTPEQIANRVDAFSKLRTVANYNPLECEQGIAQPSTGGTTQIAGVWRDQTRCDVRWLGGRGVG